MAGKKSLESLRTIVASDEMVDLKSQAVFAISQHDNESEAGEMLMNIARHNPNQEVRKKAMFWLGQMGDERAAGFFKEILIKN